MDSCVLHPALALDHAPDHIELLFRPIQQALGARKFGRRNQPR